MEVEKISDLYDLFHNVIRLHHKRMHMLFENLGIHTTHHLTLFFINHHNGCSQREISEIIGIRPASITVMLQKMEKSELIKRCIDKDDQRITRVYITEKGRQDLLLGMEMMKSLNQDCFGSLSEEDKQKFCQMLSVINESLKKAVIKAQNKSIKEM